MVALNLDSPMPGADDFFERADINFEPTVSLMIPTLNEAENLPYVLNTIPNWVDEIVLVDERSIDDTLRIAKVLHPGMSGSSRAVRRGERNRSTYP